MTEVERHPQALRQGVAAAAVVVITAGGMPAMAMRANDQRAEADATAQAMAFNEFMKSPREAGAEPSARLGQALPDRDHTRPSSDPKTNVTNSLDEGIRQITR